MMHRVKTKGIAIASVFMILSLIFVAVQTDLGAQPATHKVQRGDTLWSICEKYYGDPALWPKLWEMNPFVTNPHLLKPGDMITLIEKEDMMKKKAIPEPCTEAAKPVSEPKGVDLTSLTTPSTMGYLSLTAVEPWGEIWGSTKSEIVAQKGDKIFINFKNRKGVKPGDEFRVAVPMPVRHPLTDQFLGNLINFRGKVVVKEPLKQDFHLAEVTDVSSEFGIGAIVLPFAPLSNCIQPLATDPKLYGNIVAFKDGRKIVGEKSIVYLDSGFKDGIQRGQIFDVIKISRIPSPDVERDTLEEFVTNVTSTFSKQEYLADFWKKLAEGKSLYEFPVGKLMIVESRPDSSTAVILSSNEELSNGAFIKGFSWTEPPEFLMNLPSCALE